MRSSSGIVEGLTEFLPVSSTGHLTIAEQILGLKLDDPAITAYTAVIQMGAIAAVLLYFRTDIWRIAVAWGRGWSGRSTAATSTTASAGTSSSARSRSGSSASSARASSPVRCGRCGGSAGALIVWSAVMVLAERVATQDRGERDLTMADAIVVGPGAVHRPGPRSLPLRRHDLRRSVPWARPGDRHAAELLPLDPGPDRRRALRAQGRGRTATSVSGPRSWALWSASWSAYAAVAWLLRFVAHHSIAWFVPYRRSGCCRLLATGSWACLATRRDQRDLTPARASRRAC